MDIYPFLSPIIVAIGTGLAYLAYKHPEGFSNIADPLDKFISIIFMLYVAWMIGFQQGFYSASDLEYYREGVPISYGWTFIIYVLIVIYFKILSNLKKIISTKDQPPEIGEDT